MPERAPRHDRWPRRGCGLVLAPLMVVAVSVVPASASAPQARVGPPYTVNTLATVLDATAIGNQPGPNSGVADATAALLPNGQIRLYFSTNDGRGILSAISSDGVHFSVEPGVRMTGRFAGPRIVALPGGGWRLFGCDDQGIKSARSADGLTFTADDGYRVTAAQAGTVPSQCVGAPTIVALRDRRYRMYYSDGSQPGPTPTPRRIKSAISSDLLNWTVERGTRIGRGTRGLTISAQHPFAFSGANGSTILFYGRNYAERYPHPLPLPQTYAAVSKDGLTFTTEYRLSHLGSLDTDVIRSSSGELLIYYGHYSEQTGGSILVARLTGHT